MGTAAVTDSGLPIGLTARHEQVGSCMAAAA